MSFFNELKRRNVIRVVVAYAVMSWLLLQVADVVLPAFNVPEWTFRLLILGLAVGFIPAIVFSWVFEITPDGIKKESEVDHEQSISSNTSRKLNYITIAMVIAGVIFVLVQQQMQTGSQTITPSPGVADTETVPAPTPGVTATEANSRSIAVLPFVNMSPDPENEYFADGLSEELLNQLAQIPDLWVAGRTSSFSFKGKNEDLRVVGTTLGVANVLEGSVRRQGNQVRVTAQVIRVSDGFHLWSNTYDRSMDDVFAIQDDIASNVANALKIVLDESAWQRMQAAGVRNVDAFVEFQKGNELFERAHGTANLMSNLQEGLVHYDRAIEIVPDFAAAYWYKSDYYAHVLLEPDSTDQERVEALTEQRKVLDAAFELSDDPTRKAFIDVDRVFFSDDWTPLRDRIEKAIATTGCPDPTWIELAIPIGYAKASEDMWERHVRCEPLSSTAPLQLSVTKFWQSDYETALEILRQGEVALGASPWFAAYTQRNLLALGRSEEALALAPEFAGDTAFYGMGSSALPLALAGDVDAAREAMEAWKAENGPDPRSELEIHAAMGDRSKANELAAEIDAQPGGSVLLLISAITCSCGANFDLEATPNFHKRLEESGTPWPLETHIHYPAKDW